MLPFISLNLDDKSFQKSYEVTIFNGKMTRIIMQKFILPGTCGEVKVQKFVIYQSAVVHVVKYVKL